MIVDDDPVVLDLMQRALRNEGFELLVCPGPHEALDRATELAAQPERRIDVLLTDHTMPQINGPMLAERIAELHPRVKVIYTSGYIAPARDHARSVDAPMLDKPFTVADLRRFVREATPSHRAT